MSFITLCKVGVSTPEPLFQNLSLTIGEGCRIGVVAGNGGGKTTLLRCIAGCAEPSEGEITCSRGMRLGFVEQDVPAAFLDQTLFECLRTALPADQQTGDWRVDVLLASFEVPEEFHYRPIRALSGGWQKLALIARAFAAEPDALLLDEPTNHLDLSKIQFLERWVDWYSRLVLSWRLSNTMDKTFCVEALQEAIDRYGHPEIFNTDQGVQSTCEAFISTLSDQGIRISMDGKGRCLDNIFCERLWRSLKYEEIYLRAYETTKEARTRIGQWFAFYNDERPHQSLDYLTPRQFFAANQACAYVDNASALTTSTQAQQPQQEGDSHVQEELILSVIASRVLRAGIGQPGRGIVS